MELSKNTLRCSSIQLPLLRVSKSHRKPLSISSEFRGFSGSSPAWVDQVDHVGEGGVPWSSESKQRLETTVKWGGQRVGRREQGGMEVGAREGKDPRKLPYHRSFARQIAETSLESED